MNDNLPKPTASPGSPSPRCGGHPIGAKMLLWACSWGRVPNKPRAVMDLGNGNINLIGGCRVSQPRDDYNESFHDTREEAVARMLDNAQRDLDFAKKRFLAAERRLKALKKKHTR